MTKPDLPRQRDLPMETDVASVAAMLERNDAFLLLDVREQVEYDAAQIKGSRLIPMSELGQRVTELDDHRDSLIVVHCHHGIRSLQVSEALRQHGFAKVQSMAGGIDQWSLQVDPSVPRY